MKTYLRLSVIALCSVSLAACGGGAQGTRDSIRAVGSSTVYPFAKLVAENFARSNTDFKSPIIESTGTGGGINLSCAGDGADTPDIANASRRMKKSEFDTCQQNGVDPKDYWKAPEGHPLHGFREEYNKLANQLVDAAHTEKGSHR